VKLHLALKQIALEQKLDGFAAECWSGFPKELGLNPCLGFLEDAYTLACEGDVMLCISLLITRYLTSSSTFAGDLYDMDLDGNLTLTHCGAPASLASNKSEVVLAKSQLALERGFDTLTCRPQLERGPVTVFRFYGTECDKLHLASGELISCEQSLNLTVKIKLDGNRWDFLEQCFGNHYLAAAGDVRSELRLLCKWLGITIFET
jgi:L-fucose isomerase-like protein